MAAGAEVLGAPVGYTKPGAIDADEDAGAAVAAGATFVPV